MYEAFKPSSFLGKSMWNNQSVTSEDLEYSACVVWTIFIIMFMQMSFLDLNCSCPLFTFMEKSTLDICFCVAWKKDLEWHENFILEWTIPLIQALKQNLITAVIYWNMLLDSCVNTGERHWVSEVFHVKLLNPEFPAAQQRRRTTLTSISRATLQESRRGCHHFSSE